MRFIGWLFGLESVTSIDQIDPSFAAPWASEDVGPFWVWLGALACVALAFAFYLRWQPKGSRIARGALAGCRGLLLALLLITLADPVLRLTVTNIRNPLVYLVFDGTESMLIEDEWSDEQRRALSAAVGGLTDDPGADVVERDAADGRTRDAPREPARLASRLDFLKAFLGRGDGRNWLRRLQAERAVQVQPFIFDGTASSRLRRLSFGDDVQDSSPGRSSGGAIESDGRASAIDPAAIARQLTAEGQVTALGTLLEDIPQQLGSGNLAAVVLFSDFAHNSGTPPLGSSANSPAAKVGSPIYTVGIGATRAVDLAVDLQTDPKMKKAERANIVVKLKQTGLEGRSVNVTLLARRMSGETATAESVVGQRLINLPATELTAVEFPFTPQEAGRFEFVASVEPLDGEIVSDNNRAAREVNIIDDYLRLIYVAYEPSWEWRFIKEVFHRDKLVGLQGFRTFLSSFDPRVRESNVLFLPSLTPKRSEFFASDVLFLDDMPQSALSPRFTEMVREFVGELGGGLVVIAGPRFGPRELLGTPLADMLPVTLDPNARLRDEREFELRLTPEAIQQAFMRLDENPAENDKAWKNVGPLPWYQPVAALNKKATALAVHPFDKCADGETPQPLVAIGRYGKGEVVYLGFNETWRLRKRFGEKYYRQFWSQLIYRLGMSHALGDSKRFVPRLDRQQYRAEDLVTFSVEAYDENYEPLTEESLANRTLRAELLVPGPGGSTQLRELAVPLLRKGQFEARFPVFVPGEYAIRVQDPVTERFEERRFDVTSVSAERSRAVRDEALQRELAGRTQGRSYDLTNLDNFIDDLRAEPRIETKTRNHALWTTPLWFAVIMILMLGEWFARKWIRLS